MNITIYADVVFLINIIMDYLILWIVSKIKREKTKKLRLFLGSFSASLLYCVLIFALNQYYNFFSSLVILAISLWITFGFKNGKDFVKNILYAHIAAFFIGGVGMGLFYYTNIGETIGNAIGFTVHNFSLKILLFSSSLSFLIIKMAVNIYNSQLIKKQTFYKVKITAKEKTAEITALMDTGNSLVDPISKYPVMIAEFDSIEHLLPERLNLLFKDKKENDYDLVINAVEGTGFENAIRFIPFKSLGNENGMIIGFKPDEIELSNECEKILINKTIIGIHNFNLSKNKAYQGLLNPIVLDNEANTKIHT